MQVVLNVVENEINHELTEVVRFFERNAEVIIRKNTIILEEYNQTLPLEETMRTLSMKDYSAAFLADIEKGFKTSVYSK
ncbi:MAG: hypothetical protein RIT27_1970 [Pseudomonadota bacterium]|jgi:hypothetical protein